jgi:predicted O-methyltransferase YrrM
MKYVIHWEDVTLSRFYHAALRRAIVKTFPVWQAMGFHITHNHYFEPVPDTRNLSDELWRNHSALVGVAIPLKEEQQRFLDSLSAFRDEYEALPRTRSEANGNLFYLENRSFESVDGEVYYAMIRSRKPAQVIEVGGGFSTYLAAQAMIKNGTGNLTAIDPHPNAILRKGFGGLSRVLAVPIQDVPLGVFEGLTAGDFLFIDSSHIVSIGSDVLYEILEVLPRLKPGVIVHIHDVFLPSHYPKNRVLGKKEFWNEQYLVQAFLEFNSAYQILFAASYMHLKHPEVLAGVFSSYNRDSRWPGSLWLQRC